MSCFRYRSPIIRSQCMWCCCARVGHGFCSGSFQVRGTRRTEAKRWTTSLQLFCILLVVESVLANCNCKTKHKRCRSRARRCHPTGGNKRKSFFLHCELCELHVCAMRCRTHQRLLFAFNHRLRLTTIANSANSEHRFSSNNLLHPAICMHPETCRETRRHILLTAIWKIQPHALQRKLAKWIFIWNVVAMVIYLCWHIVAARPS